jgi:hypothetical protein
MIYITEDLSITPLFVQLLCQANILTFEILYVFLCLKYSPSLNLNKNDRFAKVSNGHLKTESFIINIKGNELNYGEGEKHIQLINMNSVF